MDDLSLVKKLIKSLVNIHPNGIAMDRLDREYKFQEGCNIPYSAYAYVSLEKLIQEELKNDVTLIREDLNIMLYPIASEKSRHLIKLVQGTATRNRSRRR